MNIPFIVVNYVPDRSLSKAENDPESLCLQYTPSSCTVASKEKFAAYGDITILQKMLQKNLLPEDDVFGHDLLGDEGAVMHHIL
jgi:hypothetical protein